MGRIDLLHWNTEDLFDPREPEAEFIIDDLTDEFELSVRPPDFSKANSYLQRSQLLNADPAAKQTLLRQAASARASETKRFYLHPMPKILHELYFNYLDANSYLTALVLLLFLFLNCDIYNYQRSHHLYGLLGCSLSPSCSNISHLSHPKTSNLWLTMQILSPKFTKLSKKLTGSPLSKQC